MACPCRGLARTASQHRRTGHLRTCRYPQTQGERRIAQQPNFDSTGLVAVATGWPGDSMHKEPEFNATGQVLAISSCNILIAETLQRSNSLDGD